MVEAHTLAGANPSTSVLEKLGLRKIETVHDPEDGELWHWRLSQQDYQRSRGPKMHHHE